MFLCGVCEAPHLQGACASYSFLQSSAPLLEKQGAGLQCLKPHHGSFIIQSLLIIKGLCDDERYPLPGFLKIRQVFPCLCLLHCLVMKLYIVQHAAKFIEIQLMAGNTAIICENGIDR